jgi:hypothetical protein
VEYAKQWREKNRERERARAQRYYAQHRDHLKDLFERGRIKRKYGKTVEELEAIRLAQGGVCAICRTRDANVVDHCHESGLFRGLLCSQCNSMLGMAKDDTTILRAGIEYLETRKQAA